MKQCINFCSELLMFLGNLQEAVVTRLLIVRILQDAAVKPFTYFSNEISMILE